MEGADENTGLSRKTLRRLALKEKKKKKNKINKFVSGAMGATSKFTHLSKGTLRKIRPLVKGVDYWWACKLCST